LKHLGYAFYTLAKEAEEFILNLLHRMHKELDVDCNPENFEHWAFYNSEV
jgi:uncharacterized SAM-dependent methyltransferase